MLSREGNENSQKKSGLINTCSTLFGIFLSCCFALLQHETSRNFLVTRFMEGLLYVFLSPFLRCHSLSP